MKWSFTQRFIDWWCPFTLPVVAFHRYIVLLFSSKQSHNHYPSNFPFYSVFSGRYAYLSGYLLLCHMKYILSLRDNVFLSFTPSENLAPKLLKKIFSFIFLNLVLTIMLFQSKYLKIRKFNFEFLFVFLNFFVFVAKFQCL